MELDEAIELVHEDYTSEGEQWQLQEVYAHVRSTLSLDGAEGTIGFVDGGDRLSEAYRVILTH